MLGLAPSNQVFINTSGAFNSDVPVNIIGTTMMLLKS